MSNVKIQVSGGQRLIENYVQAIQGAGGEPLAGYCPQPDLACGGLLLCGGGDIECSLYGQEDRGSQPPDRDRDKAEIALFNAFYQAGKPILGICRGMQHLNVLWGGRLSRLDALKAPRTIRVDHPVEVMGEEWLVNQYHNDGILLEDLAPGLVPLAVDRENGVVEAFTAGGVLAIQWHPERPFSDPMARERTAGLVRKFLMTGDVTG